MPRFRMGPLVVTLLLALAAVPVAAAPDGSSMARAQAAAVAPRAPRESPAAAEDLSTLTLVRSTTGKAVIRFGKGPLRIISAGDRLGRHRAEVIEIATGRLVLEEAFVGRDGKPNRAQIILKDGETGGKRFLSRLEEPRPVAIRPGTIPPIR